MKYSARMLMGFCLLSAQSYGAVDWPDICWRADADKIRELLESGVDLEAKDASDRTALHMMSTGRQVTQARLLLESGASLNTTDAFGNTPLHYAVHNQCGDSEERKQLPLLLLSAKADPCIVNTSGETCLGMSLNNASYDYATIELLLSHGADPNLGRSSHYESPLGSAVCHRDLAMIRLLLRHGARADGRDDALFTPLYGFLMDLANEHAKGYEVLLVLKELLAYGANPNRPNSSVGETPMCAFGRCCLNSTPNDSVLREEVVKILLANDGDPDIATSDGKSFSTWVRKQPNLKAIVDRGLTPAETQTYRVERKFP